MKRKRPNTTTRRALSAGALLAIVIGGSASSAVAQRQGFSITNNKSENIGRVVLAKPSTLTWFAEGGSVFNVIASRAPVAQGKSPLIIVSSRAGHGKVHLAPGTYQLKVKYGASWGIKVTP